MEYAASKGLRAYAILFDTAKEFKHILHRILARRALDVEYNIWLLKVLLGVYRGSRVIVVGSVPGARVHATQTIVARCALADLMRRMLTEDLDHIVDLHSYVYLSLVADDVQALGIGTGNWPPGSERVAGPAS